MQVKLLLFTFYLNDGFHAVSVRKPSEQMSNLWTVWFFKTESEPKFRFSAHHYLRNSCETGSDCLLPHLCNAHTWNISDKLHLGKKQNSQTVKIRNAEIQSVLTQHIEP